MTRSDKFEPTAAKGKRFPQVRKVIPDWQITDQGNDIDRILKVPANTKVMGTDGVTDKISGLASGLRRIG